MRLIHIVLTGALIAHLAFPSAMAAPDAKPASVVAPSPALDPAEVVRTQLNALQSGRDEDIAIVFRFASPANRSQTGPLDRFAAMLRTGYPALLEHRSAQLAPTVIEGDQAFQAVELTAQDGSIHRYVFLLGRQSAVPFQDCWMTEGVIRPDDGQAPKPPAPEI